MAVTSPEYEMTDLKPFTFDRVIVQSEWSGRRDKRSLGADYRDEILSDSCEGNHLFTARFVNAITVYMI